MIDLAHIESLATAATPGPWNTEGEGDRVVAVDEDGGREHVADVYGARQRFADARYIADMSPDVALALVAEIKRLRAALEQIADEGCETYSYADCCNKECRTTADAALRGEP